MSPAARSSLVHKLARRIGFDRIGITHAEPLDTTYYRAWLAEGHAGEMQYLHRNVSQRERPGELLAGARSIICFALNYQRPAGDPSETASTARGCGRVAQYVRGVDYHIVIKKMLAELEDELRAALVEPFEARACVDTAPVLERQLAARAGVGWIGKNTMVLSEGLGSFFFLAELITTLELAPDRPASDHCGSCTRCLEACPTQAFSAPYRMDASRCISYLTIEHRSEIPAAFHERIGDWLYGCDICQDVCPFNKKAPVATQAEITADRIPARLELQPLVELRSGAYRRLTKDSAMRRASRKMLQRNAAIAMANAARAREA